MSTGEKRGEGMEVRGVRARGTPGVAKAERGQTHSKCGWRV